jgi:hypothetical protein
VGPSSIVREAAPGAPLSVRSTLQNSNASARVKNWSAPAAPPTAQHKEGQPLRTCVRAAAAARGTPPPPIGLLVLALFVLAAMALAPGRALATPFDPLGQDWEGLSQFVLVAQGELGTQRVVVTSTLRLSGLRREDGVLLIHPERALDVDELSAFMRAGGRLILLDDYGAGDDLLMRFGIRRVPLPARPAEMLRNNPSLAIAEPASVHPIVHDLAHVVTNHATGLEHRALSPLLAVRGDGEPDVVLAVAGAVGHGRLIAVGDASIPINEMMRYPGNRALAHSLVRYATDDDVWGKRGGTLYLLANGFQTTGSFGDDARAGTAAGEARRALREGLEALRHDGMSPAAAYLAALAVGLGVVVWTSIRVGRTHRALPPRFARGVPAAAQGGVAGHAAVLGAPDTSRVLAMLELKSALEEQLATRLGLDRAPPHDELVAKVRASGLLDEDHARSLSRLLGDLGRVEAFFARLERSPGPLGRIRDAQVVAVAARVREMVEHMRDR